MMVIKTNKLIYEIDTKSSIKLSMKRMLVPFLPTIEKRFKRSLKTPHLIKRNFTFENYLIKLIEQTFQEFITIDYPNEEISNEQYDIVEELVNFYIRDNFIDDAMRRYKEWHKSF